jgi:hypothetical protein
MIEGLRGIIEYFARKNSPRASKRSASILGERELSLEEKRERRKQLDRQDRGNAAHFFSVFIKSRVRSNASVFSGDHSSDRPEIVPEVGLLAEALRTNGLSDDQIKYLAAFVEISARLAKTIEQIKATDSSHAIELRQQADIFLNLFQQLWEFKTDEDFKDLFCYSKETLMGGAMMPEQAAEFLSQQQV